MSEPSSVAPATSHKANLVSGSLWVVGGTLAIQGLRLISTLALSRMLAPDVFGIMAIVTTTLGAVTLFSEIGLQGSIIHDKQGDSAEFLNTAWSLQIGRGLMIAGFLCLLAVPFSRFYGEPQLKVLLPAIAACAIMAGSSSTAPLTLTRHLKPAKLIRLNVLAKAVALVVMLLWAWRWPSVWALVGGAIAEQLVNTIASYWLIPGYRNRFHYDREVASSLWRFGKWVWVSAIATWLVNHGDKLILGKFLTANELGVYAIASLLTAASITAIESLSQRVLQPFYASVIRDDPKNLNRRTLKVRGILTMLVLPMLWSLVFFGSYIVDILYDDRYADAGWMMRLLAVGAAATNVIRSAERVLLADGDSYRHMVVRVISGVIFLGCLGVGGSLGGLRNVILGIVVARYLSYIPLAVALHRRKAWLPQLDLLAMGSTIAVAFLAHWLVPN